MNPLSKWLLVAVGALGLLLALASSIGLHATEEAARYQGLYEEEQKLLKDERARTARIQKQVLATQAAATTARARLKEVLDASPEVRDAATPVAVRDSLCATLRCK